LLVENEDILKAKEKLGDKNATLIAEILGLQEFDTENLKALCPYHKEDTPSFIYNKKKFIFHCFGCQRNIDIIDALMKQNDCNFLTSCKKLFDYAEIKYSFGEEGVQTKSKYRYPHDENDSDIEVIYKYWGKRGISRETLDHLRVGSDGKGNTVLRFYDTNNVLTMVKYRPARTINKANGDIKNWCQKDSDSTPLLFNMNRVNPQQPLLIVEGEPDCMSAIEAGFINTVAVPLGAGNFHWIEECWNFLEQFDSIIIASDNDEAGLNMKKECVYRLGSWRTKIADYPLKKTTSNGKEIPINDLNEILQLFGKEYTLDILNNAREIPVKSVSDFSEIEDVDVSDMQGIETGIKILDSELVKIFFGTLTILSGRPGSGKTSLIDQAIANTVDSGESIFLFSKEMPEAMSTNWMNIIFAGSRNLVEKMNSDGKKYYVVPLNIKRKIRRFYKKKLFIYKDTEPNSIREVMKSMEECVRKYGVKLLVIDNLMMLDLDCNETEKNTAQTKLVNDLIEFSKKFNVAVVLIAHPKKTQDMKSDIEMYDISGSSNIINLAMRSIGLRRVSKKEKEDPNSKFGKYNVVLTIMKDRLLGKADIQMGLYYDLKSRRFFTNYEEFDKQYAWDDNVYTEKIHYPYGDDYYNTTSTEEEKEVFGRLKGQVG